MLHEEKSQEKFFLCKKKSLLKSFFCVNLTIKNLLSEKGSDTVICFENGLKLQDCIIRSAGHGSTVSKLVSDEETYKLVSVTHGVGKLCAFSSETFIKEGSLVFMLPGDRFEIIGNDGRVVKYDFLEFTVCSDKYGIDFDEVCKKLMNGENRVLEDKSISFSLGSLCSELERTNGEISVDLISHISSQLILYILRYYGYSTFEKHAQNDANVKVCNQIMSYIDNRIYSMKNLREVATAMGYNYSYISTLFHKTTGVTLNNYFKTKRMNEARKLLSDNRMSVSEIARVMNYSSVYAFSKAFKEHFGASPGRYSGRFLNNNNA